MKKTVFIAAIFSVLSFQLSVSQAQDAVYKLLRQEWTVNADGTSDYHYRHEVQILRTRALTAYADKGETFVVYNPDLEKLTVNEVYTIQKDGTRIDMPQNAFVYQLPSECADCGRFNHMRELAMVHTGMELGCTIVVDYTIHRQYNLIYETLPLMLDCPIEKYEVKVVYPMEMEVGFDFTGRDYLPSDKVIRTMSVTTDGESITTPVTLTFTMTDMPQAPRESYMPSDIVPALHLFNGTPEFVPAFDRLGLEAAQDAAAGQMNGNDRESIVAMRDFVVDNIHLNDIHPSHLGYTHATAAEVWQSGCGTATDKAVLLAAMLNQTGFTARVAGEESDKVGVMVDTLEYLLDVRHKTPMTLDGEARDEVTKYTMSPDNNKPVLDTLEDGFFRLVLPTLPGAPAVRASNLPLTRTTPVQSAACELRSDITYTLPKGMKTVKGTTSTKISHEGLGSVEISIKQSGSKLRVVRNLTLEKSLVPVADYAAYRQLLAAWQGTDSVLLRSK